MSSKTSRLSRATSIVAQHKRFVKRFTIPVGSGLDLADQKKEAECDLVKQTAAPAFGVEGFAKTALEGFAIHKQTNGFLVGRVKLCDKSFAEMLVFLIDAVNFRTEQKVFEAIDLKLHKSEPTRASIVAGAAVFDRRNIVVSYLP